MSQKIEDVLRVLRIVRNGFRADTRNSLRSCRIDAIRAIAEARGVTYQTIGDAYLRRLQPEIHGTAAFDRVTEDWLTRGTDTLRRVLEKSALDNDDMVQIDAFFRERL